MLQVEDKEHNRKSLLTNLNFLDGELRKLHPDRIQMSHFF